MTFRNDNNGTFAAVKYFFTAKKVRASLTTFSLILFIALTILNKFQFGVGFSGVILPIILFTAFHVQKNFKLKLRIVSSHIYMLFFWIFAAFSTLMSDIVTFQRNILTFLGFTLFYIISTGKDYKKNNLVIILKSYIAISFISSLNILWNFINKNAYGWQRYSLNIFGTYRDPNYVSSFIIPAIALIIYRILFGGKMNKKKKLIYYSLTFIMALGVLSTGSRAAYLVLSIVLLLCFLLYIRKIKSTKKMLISASLITIVLIVCWSLVKQVLPESVIMRLTNLGTYKNDVRLKLWKQAFELFSRYPLFGAGMESANNYLISIGMFNTHNLYLDILIGQGLVGFALLGIVMVKFLEVKKKDLSFMIIMCFSFFAPLFFINGFNTATFWTPLIICQIFKNYSLRNIGGIGEVLNAI